MFVRSGVLLRICAAFFSISYLGTASVTSSKTGSLKSKSQSARSEFERMEYVGESILPPDLHPFVKSTQTMNRELYCSGNNKLMSLNLACKRNKLSENLEWH